jgi:prepilin-type N-terminal cleavage/methylation domain-containing protein
MTVKRNEQGFSLVELLMVLVVLTIVMGVIFQQIINLQQRYKTEEVRTDVFSEAREFMDQFARDIHESAYPSSKLYAAAVLPAQPDLDSRVAVGIVSASPTDLQLEGDVDADGLVDSVRYTLVGAAGNTCPCALTRSQVIKLNGTAPWNQPTSPSTEVQGMVNSLGLGGGGATVLITGQSSIMIGGVRQVRNDDVIFAGLKNAPVFSYYNGAGQLMAVNTNVSTAAGQAVIRQIRTVRITMNLIGNTFDPATGMKPYVTLGAIAKLPNCSIYANGANPPIAGC